MQSHRQKFWSISSGKGGIGKSLLTASMGIDLARMGKSVITVDADFAEPNLQNYLGIETPQYTLVDFLEERASAEDVLLPTKEAGLRVICSAGAMLGIANPNFEQKERVIRFIGTLNAEYILVDLGSGSFPNLLDFFNMSDEGIVLVNPEPTSMHNAYEFVRSAIYRKIQRRFGTSQSVTAVLKEFSDCPETSKPRTMIDFYDHLCASDEGTAEKVAALVDSYRPHIVVNMASSEQDQRVAEIIQSACKKFLNTDLRLGGVVTLDPAVRECSDLFSLSESGIQNAIAPQQIQNVMVRILYSSAPEDMSEVASSLRNGSTTPIMGLNDNLMFKGSELHIQTEDMGHTLRCITTQVFKEGKIILSTKLEYPADLTQQSNCGQIMELMRKQHFEIIREIENGEVQAFPSLRQQ